MDSIPSPSRPSIAALIMILASLASWWIANVIKYRRSFRKLHGPLKSVPFSMWFGTIPSIAGLYKSSPQDTHPMTTMTLLTRKFGLGPMYYLDNWPVADARQIVINDADLAAQAATTYNLPKYHLYPQFIGHLVGKQSMLITEGSEWKHTRSMFNPGFAASHLMTLVPAMIDDVLIYVEKLDEFAKSGKMVQIEDALTRLTIDIMGRIVLDHDLNAQRGDSVLVNAFRKAVDWSPNPMQTNPLFHLNPLAKFNRWYWGREMDNYIMKVIQQRISQRKSREENLDKKSARRPAIDLAVDEYISASQDNKEPDEAFKRMAIDQMKSFLFAGHDTSSSTLCYIYHLLNLHPEELEKVRKEHESVFGSVEGTAERLRENAHLLNELPYTTAVIKETLRLFPPATTAREGMKGVNLTLDGVSYPTEGFMIWINMHTIMRSAATFPSPDSFIPSRFLPAPHTPSFQPPIPKDAWRPFERGPRGCIGKELAMIDIKIIMVLSLRAFEIEAVYEEWDRELGREQPGEMLGGKRGMFGFRAYQQMKGTAKPADGMPVRVRKRQ